MSRSSRTKYDLCISTPECTGINVEHYARFITSSTTASDSSCISAHASLLVSRPRSQLVTHTVLCTRHGFIQRLSGKYVGRGASMLQYFSLSVLNKADMLVPATTKADAPTRISVPGVMGSIAGRD